MEIYAAVQKGCGRNKIQCDDRILLGNEVLAEGYYERSFQQHNILLAVADGVGGRASGWKAAEMVLEKLAAVAGQSAGCGLPDITVQNTEYGLPEILQAVTSANKAVHVCGEENAAFRSMASTLSLLHISGENVSTVHLGDTRVYRLRTESELPGMQEFLINQQNCLQQLTIDWNLLNYWKTLPQYRYLEEATLKQDKKWNKLVSYIGMSPDKLEKEIQVNEGIVGEGIFILTSDGIHDFVDSGEMIEILCKPISVKKQIELLMELAEKKGSKDDKSIIIAEM